MDTNRERIAVQDEVNRVLDKMNEIKKFRNVLIKRTEAVKRLGYSRFSASNKETE